MDVNWKQVIAVTNRHLCEGDFLRQVERVASLGVRAVILREKDLSPAEYTVLAEQVMKICETYGVSCILHKYVQAAQTLGCPNLHLPLADLLKLRHGEEKELLYQFRQLGASVHSAEDALLAEQAGCTYVTAGHVFQTDCKKDLPPRGIDFLRQICKTMAVPVFAIGGIHPDNIHMAMEAGASGVCMMSELMRV